ncbi:MAG: acyl-CoA dehydrogenase family protein [Gammaproteobacteria bacterium]
MSHALQTAEALRPLLREHAAASEQQRRLGAEVFAALDAMGAFTLQLAAAHGGAGIDPLTYLEVIEALSRGDASAGWCAMVASESSGCVAAYLAPATADAILRTAPRTIVAFTAVGTGKAVVTADGLRVSGRWRFASGCRQAHWLGALCVVEDAHGPCMRPSGAPLTRVVFVPATCAELIDTWQVSGLRGTASDDFVLDDVAVPGAYGFDPAAGAVDPAPQWRIPLGLRLAMSKGAAVLGMARAILDAGVPTLTRKPFAGARPAREEPRVQMLVAEAEAALRSARAYFYAEASRTWQHARAGHDFDATARADMRLAVVTASHGAQAAVRALQRAAGTSAVLDGAFDRAARDLEVARHHLQLQDHVLEDAGRVLLGSAPLNPMF